MSSGARAQLDGFPRRDHDHLRCVADAMSDAARLCRARGARLTPLRARVLYRALEFLREQGLVHRLSSLNAFMGCSRPGHPGSGQFLICRSCGNAAELNDSGVERAITRSAASRGFAVHGHTVEISGVCPDCR